MQYKIDTRLVDGKIPENYREILIGKGSKEDLEVKIGEKITIFTPDRTVETLEVVGILIWGCKSQQEGLDLSDRYCSIRGESGRCGHFDRNAGERGFQSHENASLISEALGILVYKSQTGSPRMRTSFPG